jgi:hypothetical protein
MYLLLLAFGALLTVAGIVLGASGISIQDRIFDASIIGPGLVAAAGGLILIGLGLALRVLQRIELSLSTRPMPRPARAGDQLGEGAAEPARISLVPKPDLSAAAETAESRTPADARLQFPTVARLENGSGLERPEISHSAKASQRVDEAVGELSQARPPRSRLSGLGGGSNKATPRLDAATRPPNFSERTKGPSFDALWPKGPRPLRAAQPEPPLPPAPAPSPIAAAEPPQPGEPPPEVSVVAVEEEVAEAVSVLKSGVVDGMAYTLYSDGSIEAQLPQGMLRFGSITELRNHIEQSPAERAS